MNNAIPSVGVVLLCYNSRRQITANWQALTNITTPVKFVVIDNASTDGTQELLRRSGIPFHANAVNVGYSAGINQGFRILLEDENIQWIGLINPDIIPPPDWPSEIVQPFTDRPEVGIVGCKLVNQLGHVIHAGGMITEKLQLIYWPLSYPVRDDWSVLGQAAVCTTRFRHRLEDRKEIEQVPWVTFACSMIRTSLLREVGLLDDNFFLFCSDAQISMRGLEAGFQTWYNPSVTCQHEGSASVKAAGSDIQIKAQEDLQRFARTEEPKWVQLQADMLLSRT